MKKVRGATVAELLVAAGLFSVVVTLVLGFLVQSARWTRDIREFQGAEQDLTAGFERIVKDLVQAPKDGVLAYYPSGNPAAGDLVLAWTTAYDHDGVYFEEPLTFQPIYQGTAVVYINPASSSVLRTYINQSPDTNVVAPLQPSVQGALDPSSDQPLLKSVELFQLLNPLDDTPTDEVYNPCRLRLQVKTLEGREQKLVLNREVRFVF